MRFKQILTLFLVVVTLEARAKVSPGGKPVGIKQAANTLQPYIQVVLIELGILLLIGVLIYRNTNRIRRIY